MLNERVLHARVILNLQFQAAFAFGFTVADDGALCRLVVYFCWLCVVLWSSRLAVDVLSTRFFVCRL